MAIKESALSLITSIAQGDWVRAVTSAGASRRVTVANLAKAIVESYTGSSLAGSNQSVKDAIDSLNSNAVYSGTTSFAALDPVHRNEAGMLGGVLDTKIASVISTFTVAVHTVHAVNNGPTFGIILDRTSNSWYGGIVWTYHADYGNTPWYFAYRNGTYILRPIAVCK